MSTRRDRAAHAIALGIWSERIAQLEQEQAYRIADLMLAEIDRVPGISELLDRSSLGTPGAKALIASVSDERAQRAIDIVNRIAAAGGVEQYDAQRRDETEEAMYWAGLDETDGGASAPAAAETVAIPRMFVLYRHVDHSGVSGTGVVAEGVQWSDGAVSLRWFGEHPSTAVWGSVDAVMAIHGHGGDTELRWLDLEVEHDQAVDRC